jgi:hypothetical protein
LIREQMELKREEDELDVGEEEGDIIWREHPSL